MTTPITTRWVTRVAVTFALLVCCSKPHDDHAPTQTIPPPPSASTSASTRRSTAPAPSALPMCAKGDPAVDPLVALCMLDGDASKAHFECDTPEPLSFCRDEVTWTCVGGSAPVTFEARGTSLGPLLHSGERVDTQALRERFPRRGPLRGVAVHLQTTKAESDKLLDALRSRVRSFGCVARDHASMGETYDCGTWEVNLYYLDVTHRVYVEAGFPGAYDCF